MKTKKFNKKLALNKKTIANLSVKEMNQLQGGGTGTEVGHACSNPCETALCFTKKEPTCSGMTFGAECETYPPTCQSQLHC